MRKIKVLIANPPRLMRELVMVTVSDQSDIEVVGVLEDEATIPRMVEQSQPRTFSSLLRIGRKIVSTSATSCWSGSRSKDGKPMIPLVSEFLAKTTRQSGNVFRKCFQLCTGFPLLA